MISPVECRVDSLIDGLLKGWAWDRQAADKAATLFLLADGQQIAEITCNLPRKDVLSAGAGPETVGFEVTLPASILDGVAHKLELRDGRRRTVVLKLGDQAATAVTFNYKWKPTVHSHVDGLRGRGVEGWVLRSNRDTGNLEGNCVVRVSCEGITIGHVRADRVRTDVGKLYAASANCGFRFILPELFKGAPEQIYRFHVMPENEELTRSPLQVTLTRDEFRTQIADITDQIDQMHRQLTKLRRNMIDMLPSRNYVLDDYPEWFQEHIDVLTRRVINGRDTNRESPLVSIICPVFRPNLNEFDLAVQSVRSQTYKNWELVLVDDGSDDPSLSTRLSFYEREDHRIRVLRSAKNGGISRATNLALEAIKGDWVAFFDHDDLLAAVAIEVMIEAATSSGGKVLYSDEDKVDEHGHHSTPAFKPDWNHRLLLGVNYVCHLLFVSRETLLAAGPLNPDYDGAQDHDLVLRLAEIVPPTQIVHVPEVLYHWRVTPKSTASDVSAKPHAFQAGIKCIRNHLERIGRPAEVKNIRDSTLYHQTWDIHWEPSVDIIIPFKDEIETTKKCLRCVLENTQYTNFRVILVDNWSTSVALLEIIQMVTASARVELIRVEEPFNYSRLNNLAAQQSSAEFLFLMNNDVFVTDRKWLRTCLNEALADPAVAVVGGKLFYPSRRVQHAGVLTGIGGIAGHVGVGLSDTDYGFGGRLLFAQEYSAVTGAALLIRTDVFRKVGGFDETHLKVAFSDVDLCLKARAAGYKVVWTPDFVAEHHESLSRGDDERPIQEARFFHEAQTMKERWGSQLRKDPFYNRNFSQDRAPFTELTMPDGNEQGSEPGPAIATHVLFDRLQSTDFGPKLPAKSSASGANDEQDKDGEIRQASPRRSTSKRKSRNNVSRRVKI